MEMMRLHELKDQVKLRKPQELMELQLRKWKRMTRLEQMARIIF